jgi:hypothetical protein
MAGTSPATTQKYTGSNCLARIPATFSTRSASRSAASSLPTVRAAAAIAVNFAGSAANAEISDARRSGINSACAMRSAPSTFASTPALANWS